MRWRRQGVERAGGHRRQHAADHRSRDAATGRRFLVSTGIGAPGVVLLPIVDRKRTVGLIYADSNSPATLHLSGEELGLLKALRNQAVLAMRQYS
jgi:hypothetical protein